jgi:hypothetical protein
MAVTERRKCLSLARVRAVLAYRPTALTAKAPSSAAVQIGTVSESYGTVPSNADVILSLQITREIVTFPLCSYRRRSQYWIREPSGMTGFCFYLQINDVMNIG